MHADIRQWLQEHKTQMFAELDEIIRFKSVSRYDPESKDPFGLECTGVVNKAIEIAARHGLSGRNMENFCGYARLDANDEDREFGIFAHLDVVPELDGWFEDPYKIYYRDGYAIARGIADNKGAGMAALYALDYLRTETDPRHNWLLYFGLNEESGMRDIQYFLEHHPAPELSLVPDAGFPVCYAEKSHVNIRIVIDLSKTNIVSIDAGIVPNILPGEASAVIADKAAFEQTGSLDGAPTVSIKAVGRSAHASMPEHGINALGVLAEELLSRGLVNREGEKVLKMIAGFARDYHGETQGIQRIHPEFGDTSHVMSIARVNGRDLELTFDIRFTPTTPAQEIVDTLKGYYGKQGIPVEILRFDDAIPKDPHAPLIKALTKISNEGLGMDAKPYTMGGGTYARRIPNAYGFGLDHSSPRAPFIPEGQGDIHQPNESIHIEEFLRGVEVFIKGMLWLDKNEK